MNDAKHFTTLDADTQALIGAPLQNKINKLLLDSSVNSSIKGAINTNTQEKIGGAYNIQPLTELR